ncbi:MAG: hypothetical protein O9246_00025 [Brevundimonas sp.]|nr:hypothetical protein [Brevundimonas sp.]
MVKRWRPGDQKVNPDPIDCKPIFYLTVPGRGLEVPENTGVAHRVRLAALPVSGKPIFL